jgi:hypothetical protein
MRARSMNEGGSGSNIDDIYILKPAANVENWASYFFVFYSCSSVKVSIINEIKRSNRRRIGQLVFYHSTIMVGPAHENHLFMVIFCPTSSCSTTVLQICLIIGRDKV